MSIVLAKVWPLEPGVKGLAPHDYSSLELTPGTPGFMDYPDAVAAEKENRVQLMAGKGWGELKEPRTEPKPKVTPKPEPKSAAEKMNEYRTADMTPEEPQVQKEESSAPAPNGYKTVDMKPKRRPGRPRKNAAQQ